ncbi:hypothetical protein NW754_003195 [Fusarium falciforme]|nr:hypothetical protein NW754_003195 [Fusarium falciforme]
MSKPEIEALEHYNDTESLSEEHKQYLLKRHGTINLDPVPYMSDADPLNWPKWKKIVNLSLVAFHAMMATFTAAAIQSAFVEIAEDRGTNGVQFILHGLFGPETRFEPSTRLQENSSFRQQYLSFRRIDPKPLKLRDFLHPLSFIWSPNVIIPAVAHAMVFLWGSVMTTFEIPQVFPEKFGFNTQQVGLQYIGIIIGTILGEQIGGILSDKWMGLRERRGKQPEPEYRLWLSYIGYLTAVCGVVVFLVQLDRASETWDATPIVGAGIAAAGNQIVTTIMITYAVDCYHEDAAAVGVFITFIRQVWGFIGPFW